MSMRGAQSFDLRSINLFIAIAMVSFFLMSIGLPDRREVIGIASRLVFAAFCFINGAWLYLTRKSALGAGALIAVGAGLLVTALAGYSFNGMPPVPWLWR